MSYYVACAKRRSSGSVPASGVPLVAEALRDLCKAWSSAGVVAGQPLETRMFRITHLVSPPANLHGTCSIPDNSVRVAYSYGRA
jgi:hypothetical protein